MTVKQFRIDGEAIYGTDGRLDPWAWTWVPTDLPSKARDVSASEALRCLKATGGARRLPIGVVGPRQASAEQYACAERIGRGLADLGLTVVCGGKSGVMEAAAKGALQNGGLTVGLLPDHDWRGANPFITLPIATGLSEARNLVIAKSCLVLIAIGGSYGTLSEIAFGLHFSKPVIGLCGAPNIDGMETAESAAGALDRVATHLLTQAVLS